MSANETLKAIERLLFPSGLKEISGKAIIARLRAVIRTPEEDGVLKAVLEWRRQRERHIEDECSDGELCSAIYALDDAIDAMISSADRSLARILTQFTDELNDEEP